MKSTDKQQSGQGLAFDRIYGVRRIAHQDGYKFRVELRNSADAVHFVEVTASQMGSYQRFQATVLRQESILFRDELYERQRAGKEAWREDLWLWLEETQECDAFEAGEVAKA